MLESPLSGAADTAPDGADDGGSDHLRRIVGTKAYRVATARSMKALGRGRQCRPGACVCGQLRCRHAGPDTRSQTHGSRHAVSGRDGADLRSQTVLLARRRYITCHPFAIICHQCALREQFAPHPLNVCCADGHGVRVICRTGFAAPNPSSTPSAAGSSRISLIATFVGRGDGAASAAAVATAPSAATPPTRCRQASGVFAPERNVHKLPRRRQVGVKRSPAGEHGSRRAATWRTANDDAAERPQRCGGPPAPRAQALRTAVRTRSRAEAIRASGAAAELAAVRAEMLAVRDEGEPSCELDELPDEALASVCRCLL
eukprot:COSAG06_NODE_13465_length_1254_cov_1.847619_1_plen_315_part_01